MKAVFTKVFVILASAAMLGTSIVTSAIAAGPDDEPCVIVTAQEDGDGAGEGDGTGLSEEEMEFSEIAGTIVCYNNAFKEDISKGNKAIEFFLNTNGLSLEEYKELERKYRGNEGVQKEITAVSGGCTTMVLVLPPEGEDDKVEELTPTDDKTTTETEEKKDVWSWKKKGYKGNNSDGGDVTFMIQKDKKTIKGSFKTRKGGDTAVAGCTGRLDEKKATAKLNCTSGKGSNNVQISITFKKKSDKYKEASFSYSGKMNGVKVSGSGTANLR